MLIKELEEHRGLAKGKNLWFRVFNVLREDGRSFLYIEHYTELTLEYVDESRETVKCIRNQLKEIDELKIYEKMSNVLVIISSYPSLIIKASEIIIKEAKIKECDICWPPQVAINEIIMEHLFDDLKKEEDL